jgi:hypothetical protein
MPAPIIGPLIVGGSQLASSAIGAIGANRANRRTIQANKEAAELEWNRNIDFWNKQNEYNSPVNQMKRLSEAGLNPNLVYGSGATANQSAPAPRYQRPQIEYKSYTPDLSSAVSAFLDTQLKMAQIDAVNAQTKNVEAKTETEKFTTALRDITGQRGKIALSQESFLAPYQQDVAVEKHLQEGIRTDILFQQLMNMKTDEATKLLQQDYVRNKVSQQQIDKEKKEADLLFKRNQNELRKIGVTENDNIILRLFIRALKNAGIDVSTFIIN